MEFHEYGGLFKFLKNTSGKENEGQLLFQISPSDVNSNVPLKENGVRVYSPNNKPTAADLGINIDAIVSRETELAKVEYASSVNITGIRSYIDVTGDVTVTLPSYSDRYSEANPFTYEHHVYMKFTDAHTVTFADTIKWQSVPTIKAGTVIDFIFNFIHADANTNFWLGGAVVYE